jgi:hypothetical protein
MSLFMRGIGSIPTAYRDGNTVVVPLGCSLPANCVKCGSPISGTRLTKTFRWHSPGLYLLIFLGLIPYIIVRLTVAEKVCIDVPFCQAHRAWRTRMNITGAVLLITSIPSSFLWESLELGVGVTTLIVVGMAFLGLVVLGAVGSSFNPVYVDERCSMFNGAAEEFLSLLPSSPVSPQKGLAS